MYENERWQIILHLLDEYKSLTVNDLTKHINASPATLRRDIIKLDELKLIQKVHGGIRLRQTDENINKNPLINPDKECMALKDNIVQAAISEIEDNDCVYISCSDYTFSIINAITQQDISIITDVLPSIHSFHKPNLNFYFLEGDIDFNNHRILFSDDSVHKLESLNFNKIFIYCDAIDKDIGFSTSNVFDFKVKSILCQKNCKLYAITKKEAFDKHKFMSYANISDLTIISTDIPTHYKNIVKTLPGLCKN